MTSPYSHSLVEIHSPSVHECDGESSFTNFSLLHSQAYLILKKFCFFHSSQVMAPKQKSSNISRGESFASLDIHPRRMRLMSWTNPRPTRVTRPIRSPTTRPDYLRDPVPIVIGSSDLEDHVFIPDLDSSSETKSSSELESIPVSKPTLTSGIRL